MVPTFWKVTPEKIGVLLANLGDSSLGPFFKIGGDRCAVVLKLPFRHLSHPAAGCGTKACFDSES